MEPKDAKTRIDPCGASTVDVLFKFQLSRSDRALLQGKHIKIVVGFTAGGIIDLCARLYTQYMGKYIPGNPDLLVVFRRKGA
jgi:tripartite-type tricarboxylate transporter receptor subunit TctC